MENNKSQLLSVVALLVALVSLVMSGMQYFKVDLSNSDASTPTFTQTIVGTSLQRVGSVDVLTIKLASDKKTLLVTNAKGATVGKYTAPSGTLSYSVNGTSSDSSDLAARIIYARNDVAMLLTVASQALNAQAAVEYTIVRATDSRHNGLKFKVMSISGSTVSAKIIAIPGMTSQTDIKVNDLFVFPKGTPGTPTTSVPFV